MNCQTELFIHKMSTNRFYVTLKHSFPRTAIKCHLLTFLSIVIGAVIFFNMYNRWNPSLFFLKIKY